MNPGQWGEGLHPSQWGEAMLGPYGHVAAMPPIYMIAPMPPGAPHPQHHVAAVAPMQQQLLAQQAEEMRKSAKRAANRRSANTCRLRKKYFVENMAEANESMRKRTRVLSLLPDMILAMRRDGVITYASENCLQFLQFTRKEVEGTNIFDLVESGSHNRLRRLLEENLGSVSKQTIASALRHQGTTFESLLARAEKAKEQGDSGFFAMSGEAPRLPGPSRSGRGGGTAGGAGDMDGTSDDWQSEVTNSACESQGRTTASCTSTGGGSGSSGSGGSRKPRRGCVGSSGSGGMSDSSGGEGGGGRGGGGNGKGTRSSQRPPLSKLDPAAFPASGGDKGAAAAAQVGGGTNEAAGPAQKKRGRPTGGALPGDSVFPDGSSAREGGGAVRKLELDSDTLGESCGGGGKAGVGDGGGDSKASMVNVDRELQSKINAFNNAQKDLCKLEIMRQDKKFEWYEVRSSMRLAWLKAEQMIIPVEVICSFQQMHTDSPAGSSNSIVARLQRAASAARPLATGTDDQGKSGDYLSGNSSGFSGSGGSGDSNGARSPDLEDNSNDAASQDLEDNNSSNSGRCGDPSSEDRHASEADSSDYGGGTSSGSVSGDGNSAHNNGSVSKSRRIGGGGGGELPASRKRKRARRVCAPLPEPTVVPATTVPAVRVPSRGNWKQQQQATAQKVATAGGARREGGAAGGPEREWGAVGGMGGGASPTSALAALAAAAAMADQAAPLTPSSTRLAAKKSILFRH